MSEPVRVIRIAGTYTGSDPVGWHLLRRDRESVGGGPFRYYADALAAARAQGFTIENLLSDEPYGRHADDVAAAIEQVERGE